MGAVRTRYLAPTIPICTLHWTLTYLGTSMYIGPHTCMSGYVSAYHGVGKLHITAYDTMSRSDVYRQMSTHTHTDRCPHTRIHRQMSTHTHMHRHTHTDRCPTQTDVPHRQMSTHTYTHRQMSISIEFRLLH